MNPQDQAAQNAQPQSTQPAIGPDAPAAEKKKLSVKFEDDLIIYLDSEVVNDMRFFELYSKAESNPAMIGEMFKFLFGEAQWEGVFEYYESKGQKFTISKFTEVFRNFEAELNANPDFLSL